MMSSGMDRRLRRRYNNEETASPFSKSLSHSIKTQGSPSLSSSTSSSPHVSNTVPEKKVRRKKIRSTQDFNHLRISLASVDSNESTKSKLKKTKKNKIVYSLPKITNVVEDPFAKPEETCDTNNVGLGPKKKGRKKSRKQNDHAQDSENDLESKQCTKNDQVIEKYHSANSISDSGRDSEVEIITKNKRPRNRKNNTISNTTDLTPEVQINTFEGYATRIKKLLINESFRKTKDSDASSSLASTPVFGKKSRPSSSTKKISTKPTVQETPKADTDQRNSTSKRSVSLRMSRQSTPHPKIKLCISSHDTLNEQPCVRGLSENLSAIVKIKQKSSMLNNSVSFDMDFESDDVFVDNHELQTSDVINTNCNQQETINKNFSSRVSTKVRKSVRFKSPEQNISQNMSHELLIEECKVDDSYTTGIRASISGSTKRNSTFEISSPKVINSKASLFDASQDANYTNRNISYEHSAVTLSTQMVNNSLKRKSSSMELFSPHRKSFRKSASDNDVSIQNTVKTPICVTQTEISGIRELDTVNVYIPHVQTRQSISTKDPPTKTEVDQDEKNCSSYMSNKVLPTNTPKLVRSATFTKDDESVKRASDLPSDLKYSSPLHTSYSKPVDTSKVNKRRRWDKSRLSVSFLDNSLDIGNISAPWLENNSNKTFNLSANISEQNLETKCSPKVSNVSLNRISMKNRGTPPSASSTPFLKSKTGLLKQTLLKDKKDISINEKKAVNEKSEPRKIVRTKVPNFALIHQRALNKMENIKEMSERKAARAKLLLSGHKPPNDSIRKESSNKRELKFSPTRLKSTPLKESITRIVNKSNISITKIGKVSPSKSNPKVTNKENRITPIDKKKEQLKIKSLIPVKSKESKVPQTVVAEKKGFTRFGFKQRIEGARPATKDEQVKAVAQKSKIMKNTVEERRTVIQGVRSNRRFELLMQRRNK